MKRIFIGSLCVLGVVVAGVAVVFWPKFANMKSEYITAGVIRDVMAYVERTDGNWPTSWKDLGTGDMSVHTEMDFSLAGTTATRAQVHQAIRPKNGKYYTYPHAESQLDTLYDEIEKHRKQRFEQGKD